MKDLNNPTNKKALSISQKDLDDFDHYFYGCQRLSQENTSLKRKLKLRDQEWIEAIEKLPRGNDRGLDYMFMTVGLWEEIKSKMEDSNENWEEKESINCNNNRLGDDNNDTKR